MAEVYTLGQTIIKGTTYVYEGKTWIALQNRSIGTVPKPNTIWQEVINKPEVIDKFAIFSTKFTQLIDIIIMAAPSKYRSYLEQLRLLGLAPEEVVIKEELEQEVADAFSEVVKAERYLNPIDMALNSTETQIINQLNTTYPAETSGAAVIITGTRADGATISYIKGTTTWAKNPNFFPNVTNTAPGLATPTIKDYVDKAPAPDKVVSIDDTDISFPGTVKGITKNYGQKDVKEFTTLEEVNRERHRLVSSNLGYVATYTIAFTNDLVKSMTLTGDIVLNLAATVPNNFPQIIKLKAGTAQRKITINPIGQVWGPNIIFLPAGKEIEIYATPYGTTPSEVVIKYYAKP